DGVCSKRSSPAPYGSLASRTIQTVNGAAPTTLFPFASDTSVTSDRATEPIDHANRFVNARPPDLDSASVERSSSERLTEGVLAVRFLRIANEHSIRGAARYRAHQGRVPDPRTRRRRRPARRLPRQRRHEPDARPRRRRDARLLPDRESVA